MYQRLVVGVPLVWGWRVNGVGLVDGTRMSDRQSSSGARDISKRSKHAKWTSCAGPYLQFYYLLREEVFVVSESCLSGLIGQGRPC